MSTNLISSGTTAREKVNLRTPEVMTAVQEQVESHYRSDIVDKVRRAGGTPDLWRRDRAAREAIRILLRRRARDRSGLRRAQGFQGPPALHRGRDHSQPRGQRSDLLVRHQKPDGEKQGGGHRGSKAGRRGDRAGLRHRAFHLAANQGARLPDCGHHLRRRDECVETGAQICERIRHVDHPWQGRARGNKGDQLARARRRQRALSRGPHPAGHRLCLRLHPAWRR